MATKPSKDNYLPMGQRIMDIAYMWDNRDIQHTGEALMLACLVHTKGKREPKEIEYVAKMLDDVNLVSPRNKKANPSL